MALPHLRPIALSLLVAFSTAHADETTLSAVNVTAKGYAATDLDTPISTTALDREEIARRGGQNLGDALRGVLCVRKRYRQQQRSEERNGKWVATHEGLRWVQVRRRPPT